MIRVVLAFATLSIKGVYIDSNNPWSWEWSISVPAHELRAAAVVEMFLNALMLFLVFILPSVTL